MRALATRAASPASHVPSPNLRTPSPASSMSTVVQRAVFAFVLAVSAFSVAALSSTNAHAAEGSPAQRTSLLPLVQPLWSELSGDQQAVLEPFADEWNTWSAAEKRTWVRLANRMPNMSDEKRERAQRRVAEWASLTIDQRRLARQNYRLAKRLRPEQRQAQWERYRELTPEQRAVLRTSGWTSNTAARHAGARTGLAKEAAQPLAEVLRRTDTQPAERRRRIVH